MNDAGRYRRIYANDWHDPAMRRLNAEARVVRLYVSAGPQTTSVGCFRLSTAVAVEDLGGTPEAFEAQLETVCEAMKWAWDSVARVIWISDWFRLNAPASPNVVRSWAKLLMNVPDCEVKAAAVQSISHSLKNLPASFGEAWEELSKTFPQPKVQPKVRSKTNQGSGIRDQGSEIREQARYARDAEQRPDGRDPSPPSTSQSEGETAKNAKMAQPGNPTLLAVAERTLTLTNPNQEIDELLDAFSGVAAHDGLTKFTRDEAKAALKVALLDRRLQ